MKRLIATYVLFLVLSMPALADEPAMGFWVVDVAELQTAIQDYGTMDRIDNTGMAMLAECSGRFGGTNVQFRIQSDSLSFDIRGRDDGTVLNYSAVLGWGKIKRSALQFRGTVAVTDKWSFPDEWEMRKHVIIFKRLNLKK